MKRSEITKAEIRKQVFFRAHRMAKRMEGDYKACFAYCLKMQWACFKEATAELPELEGSPKQIAWANDIRDNLILDPLFEIHLAGSTAIEFADDTFANLENKKAFIHLLRTQKSAKFWISCNWENVQEIAFQMWRARKDTDYIFAFGKSYNPDYYRLIDGQFVNCDMWGEIRKRA